MQSPPRRSRGRLDAFLDIIGRTLIASGLLLLSFVAYQLWGTGISEGRAQSELARRFASTTTTSISPTPTTEPQPLQPRTGDIVGKISIPSIGVSKWLIAGVGYKQLEQGPGLFSGSPLPGQRGNVAIAGHRTTYGAPFSRINELKKNDTVVVTTATSTYTYVINRDPFIVSAHDVGVVRTKDPSVAALTLVSCHPKWTSKQRIIVTALLEKQESAQPPTTYEATNQVTEVLNEGWFHDLSSIPQTIGLAVLLIAIWIGGVLIKRQGRSPWAVYPITIAIFAPVLFVFFGYLTRLLPTNL